MNTSERLSLYADVALLQWSFGVFKYLGKKIDFESTLAIELVWV